MTRRRCPQRSAAPGGAPRDRPSPGTVWRPRFGQSTHRTWRISAPPPGAPPLGVTAPTNPWPSRASRRTGWSHSPGRGRREDPAPSRRSAICRSSTSGPGSGWGSHRRLRSGFRIFDSGCIAKLIWALRLFLTRPAPGHEVNTQSSSLLPLLTDDQRQVLGDLYRENFARVLSLCRSLLRSPEDAADAAHEVFVKAIGGLQPGASAESARSWLLTVARNHCLDVLRRRHRLGKAMITVQAEWEGAADPEMAILDRQVVGSIFRQLRLRERQALWQSAVEGRPLAEIATDLRLSYMAAAQLLHRARRRAALVAGKVAAFVGLVQLARVARRATLAGSGSHHLLAAAVLPLVLATVTVSSSPARIPMAPPLSASPGSATAGGQPFSPNRDGAAGSSPGAGVRASEGPNPVGLPQAATTLSSATSVLDGSAGQLSSIMGALPAPPATLPTVVPSASPLPIPPPVPTPGG
ncbi:MAG: sigma-70 family RNA polymerase sigma factor [Chloroflexi bacterium]|nr:MAG: sigma-70 family RNA polymerase sigma factor [Chloroflexota bacterium]